jgi:hypothetical protein
MESIIARAVRVIRENMTDAEFMQFCEDLSKQGGLDDLIHKLALRVQAIGAKEKEAVGE